jgi:hypothetical protein
LDSKEIVYRGFELESSESRYELVSGFTQRDDELSSALKAESVLTMRSRLRSVVSSAVSSLDVW